MVRVENEKFGSVGKCIYCGSTSKLSKEHIIPFGLDGKSILYKASCGDCAAITSNFERDVLKGTYDDFRISMDFPSRRKDQRPEFLPISIETNDGEEKELELPLEDYFPNLTMVEYPEPGKLVGRDDDDEISVIAASLFGERKDLEEFGTKYNVKSIKLKTKYTSHSLPRLLSKIAYGYAVGLYSLENIEENYLVPYILGEKSEGIGYYVGTAKDKILDGDQENLVQFDLIEEGEILCRIKLFARYNTPEYLVLVGRLKEEAIKEFKDKI